MTTESNEHRNHPVSGFMIRDIKVEQEDQSVLGACEVMHENNIGSVIIVKKDYLNDIKPVGIITERDVVRMLGSLNPILLQVLLKDIMTKPVITVSVDRSIKDAIHIMQQKNICRLVISDNDKMVGLVTDKDIFKVILNDQNLVPSLLNEKLLIQSKSAHDQLGQYWLSNILRIQ